MSPNPTSPPNSTATSVMPSDLYTSQTNSTAPSVLGSDKPPFINDLPSLSQPVPSSRPTTSLKATITTAHTSHILIVCCMITGLLDSTLFYAYGTFVSGQTGNTILFGLGAATSHLTERLPYRWAKSLVAMITFSLGCACFSHTMRVMGKLRRGTLVLSFVFQSIVVLIVAAFIQAEVVEGRLHNLTEDVDWRQILPIALLSFQSAGQITCSRALGHDGIPTIVLTSLIHDIVVDRSLLKGDNVPRNRRVGGLLATLVGAIAGGFISIGTNKVQSTLWVVAGLKMGIAVAWGIWPVAEEDSPV